MFSSSITTVLEVVSRAAKDACLQPAKVVKETVRVRGNSAGTLRLRNFGSAGCASSETNCEIIYST